MIHYVKDYGYNKVTGTKLIKRAVLKIAVKVVLFNRKIRKELLQKDVNIGNSDFDNSINVNIIKIITKKLKKQQLRNLH